MIEQSAVEAYSILRADPESPIRWRAGERLEHLFERRCDKLGGSAHEAIAVEHAGVRVSYGELEARANQLARFLLRTGAVEPGDRVALLLEGPVNAYVAMLAVLKAHAAYVPLDSGFPPDRLAYIVADARATLLITEAHLSRRLGGLDAAVRILSVDETEGAIAAESGRRMDPEEVDGSSDEVCYVIYTSGTTGQPKGVVVAHPSICNFVRVADEVYGLQPDDRLYQGLTMAFDFSVEEIWVAWMAGATLVPKPTGGPLLGPELHDFLTTQRVTALCCVPTLLATLDADLPELRFLLVSGEACPLDVVERWSAPGRRFLNVYGPTETTVSATWTLLDPERPVTIGAPLPTYSVVVLDPQADRALRWGEEGELGIAGVGLAEGYLGRPDLTQRAFIKDFLSLPHNPTERIYRTGDLVRLTKHGEIEHRGRIDGQVKLRGYRIELEEIETVLRRQPGIAQAVVSTHEPRPGQPELVAYYCRRAGTETIDVSSLHEGLRSKLPAYMVPAFLEELESIPFMPSGKVDRRSLPRPRGLTRALATEGHVPPVSSLETMLAAELSHVLAVERISVESHFFHQLGANSLLMAQFAARLRQVELELAPVSIRDIYEHPTVRRLAQALEAPGAAREVADPTWEEPELPPAAGTPHYVLCGALQLLVFLAYVSLMVLALDAGATWLFAASGAVEIYLRATAVGAGLLLGMGGLPIAAKWILIGRFKPQSIRAWSLGYLRFWIVKTLAVSSPLAHLFVGSPLYSLYLRAMGAKIGRRVLIFSQHVPVCTDLLAIGPDTVVHKDVFFNGYRARAGAIEIGPTTLGEQVFLGERTVLDIHTAAGDGATLGHTSSLQAGQRVPSGQCWHGSPARPAPVDFEYRGVDPARPSALRAFTYAAGRILLLLLVLAPLEAALSALLLTHPRWLDRIPLMAVPLLAVAATLGAVLASLVIALTVPHLLTRALEPGRVYPLYGWHYRLQRIVARTSNNSLLTGLFGDSCAIVHYLRMLGYRFGVIEQTGSNFGLNVRQEVPALSHVGTGTMVSDGLSMMNAEFSSTSFRVRPVVVGRRAYVGNEISYPAAARTGDDCLFATKAMVPIGGPELSGVGLLGSPCFEIPRSVMRDQAFGEISTGPERGRRLAAKTRHNVVTMGLHLLLDFLLLGGLLLVAFRGPGAAGDSFLATAGSGLLDVSFMLVLFVLAERAVTGFRALSPRYCSIYQIEFWRHERFWKVAPTGYTHMFDGTPFKSLLWRALGASVGRRVLDDGLAITERSLVRIGSESTFNLGSTLQSHTLEDGVFKSDLITVGERCTLGVAALVNYGASMGDEAVLDADAFLMKGSRVQPGARWGGNPAAELSAASRGLALSQTSTSASSQARRSELQAA